MSSFFFALVPDAMFTGARLAFPSAHVSQCPAAPSFQMCIPSTSFVSRAISLKLLCPSALCHRTRVLLWAAWLPNQGDQPLRPTHPCAMPERRSTGGALGPRLHTKNTKSVLVITGTNQRKMGPVLCPDVGFLPQADHCTLCG